MTARLRCLALLAAVCVVFVGAQGCAVEGDGDDEPVIEGEGDNNVDVSNAELVTKNQLTGSELPSKTLSLTFDDGPGPRTAELADYLAAKGIKATFFINGMKVPGRQGALDRVVGRGHLLANHTQNHKQLTRLSGDQVRSEVRETHRIIGSVQPNRPFILRAPFGAWNANVANAINETGLKKYVGSVFWDVGGELTGSSAADWDCWGRDVTVHRCGDLYMQEISTRGRGIVLMHDIHSRTIDMVKYIVPKLQAQGYKFAELEDVPSIKRAIARD